MNVADSKTSSNPSSIGSTTINHTLRTIDSIANRLKDSVQNAAERGESFDSVERSVREAVFQLGNQAIELFIQLQGQGDLGPQITTDENETLRRSEKIVATTIRSIFGTHRFKQFSYASGPKKTIKLRPISARMSLPARQWSYLLQEFSQMLAVDSAYEQAMHNLGKILGGTFSVDTAERINAELGHAAGEFLGNLPDPEPDSEAKLLVASADCKGVPLVTEDSPKVAAFETAKKKPGNRRMATVASVYTVEPHVRTAEEITAALFRDEPAENATKADRPRPANKNTTAHFPEVHDDGDGGEFPISGIHVAMAWVIGQVTARRRAGQVLIALMDGQESLWGTMKLHLSFNARTIPILDILHALSYVWEAAGLFEKDEDDRMRYDEYLRRGYPIASGVIEGACRHLVKDRMERSGMRWTLEGARSMLNVRAAFQSDHWQAFLEQRITSEVKQVHPNQNLLADYQPMTLAC